MASRCRPTFLERSLGCARFLLSYFSDTYQNSFGPQYAGELRFENVLRNIVRLSLAAIPVPHHLIKRWVTFPSEKPEAVRSLRTSQWLRLQVVNSTTWPKQEVPYVQYPPPPQQVPRGACRVTYMGHSGILIQMDETNLLVDTYFGRKLGPRWVLGSWESPTPFGLVRALPPAFDFGSGPPIHAILVSHDHWDTFDKPVVKSLLHWNGPTLIGGRGLGRHVWRTDGPSIYCLDWYETIKYDLLKIQFLPALHSSGRGACLDRNSVLWGSFLICSDTVTVFHAGGTGFSEHFEVISRLVRDDLQRTIDLAILPIGQYEVGGIANMFMTPDEAVKAHLILGARQSIGVHHDTFPLGLERFGQARRDLLTSLHRENVSPRVFWVLEPGQHLSIAGQAPGADRICLYPQLDQETRLDVFVRSPCAQQPSLNHCLLNNNNQVLLLNEKENVEVLGASVMRGLLTKDVVDAAKARKDVPISNYAALRVELPKMDAGPPPLSQIVRNEKICESALELVGRTPMVRLARLAKKYGVHCDLVAKCEFLSIGGSVKDRIALKMVTDAEESGRLKPGAMIVEATSGNTGIGLCLTAAVKGYHTIITLPEKMSAEKFTTMSALGAEIVRTPTEAAWNCIESHIGLAHQLEKTLPNCHLLDQYKNVANPAAHCIGTAEEILYQTDGQVDMIVIGAGTGGTITGIAAKVKQRLPHCKIVGVDPMGSILAEPEHLNDLKRNESYLVEGIGYDFIPPTLDRSLVDEWVKVDDAESLTLARELIRVEGLLVGGSSGAALAGALKVIGQLKHDQRCVVLLPDSSRNYMTKFLNDDWMVDNGFYTPRIPTEESIFGNTSTIADLPRLPEIPVVGNTLSCADAVKRISEGPADVTFCAVQDADGTVKGIATVQSIMTKVTEKYGSLTEPIQRYMDKKFKTLYLTTKLAEAADALKTQHPFALVFDNPQDRRLQGALYPKTLLTYLQSHSVVH